jgi:heptosyltransferase-1
LNILLLRVGRLGDMVMVAPAIRYLLDSNPEARFTLVTSPDGERVYRDFDPRLERIWTFPKDNLGRYLAGFRLRRWLQENSFDRIVCFENKKRYHSILSASTATEILTMKPDPGSYRYGALRALDFVGHPNPPSFRATRALLPVSEDGEKQAANMLARLGIADDDMLVGIHPGFSASRSVFRTSARRKKRWPAGTWAQLADSLTAWAKQTGIRMKILIDIVPEEAAIAREIASSSRCAIVVSSETPDFARYKSVLRRMDLFIAPDTGTMHLAAAMGCRVVALYAGGGPESSRDTPLYEDRLSIVRAANRTKAMDEISVEQVFEHATRLAGEYLPNDRYVPADAVLP